jgi:Uma2 family endonuclease
MGTTTTPPAQVRLWTRLEYERLIDLGVFQPGERLELIDGLLLVREPQGRRHAATIRRVLVALRRALGDDWQIDSQLPIALDDASEPEPDAAVVPRDPAAYRDAHPSRVLLIVEVAETSYRIDREYKASLDARSTAAPKRRRPRSTAGATPPSTCCGRQQNVTPLIAAAPIRVADLFP